MGDDIIHKTCKKIFEISNLLLHNHIHGKVVGKSANIPWPEKGAVSFDTTVFFIRHQ